MDTFNMVVLRCFMTSGQDGLRHSISLSKVVILNLQLVAVLRSAPDESKFVSAAFAVPKPVTNRADERRMSNGFNRKRLAKHCFV